MQFTLSQQMICLWWAFVCGLILGLIYDVLKVIRLCVFTGKTAVFICDIVFMILSAFVSVAFSIGFARGNTRYFIIFGELMGFIVLHFTFGRVMVSFFCLLFRKGRRIIQKTIDKFTKYPKRVLQDTI